MATPLSPSRVIDLAKERQGFTRDAELASALQVPPDKISKWRSARQGPSWPHALTLLASAGLLTEEAGVQVPREGLGVLAETVSNLTRAAGELADRVEALERRQQLRPAGQGRR